MKKYLLIAGVNGAGKSTLYQTLDALQVMERVNIDEIELHYVGLESIELAKQRIAYRVAHGGHGIPDADVERRYVESFEHLNMVKDKCDLVVLYDNTEVFNRFAIYKNGDLYVIADQVPMWFEKYIK